MAYRILIDTNVLLDYLLCREPYEKFSRKIIIACKDEEIEGFMAAHSISNIFYILRKKFTTKERRQILLSLCNLITVVGIDKGCIENALRDEAFEDFEDCLQKECAVSIGADYIITRNIIDFAGSTVPCLGPDEFCKMI